MIGGLFAEDRSEHFHRPFRIVGLVMQMQDVTLANLVGTMMEQVRQLFVDREHCTGGRPENIADEKS